MIISASRRTDIPALYADWFFHRLAAGEVLVSNPFNQRQGRRVSLLPADVDGFVFWSRYPAPMVDRLHLLGDIPFYFQVTLTPYGPDFEPGLPSEKQRMDAILRLADRLGPQKVVWRYDPIFLSSFWTPDRHEERFGALAHFLSGSVCQCTFSFLDRYRKIEGTLSRLGIEPWTEEAMRDLAGRMSRIAAETGLRLATCAEKIELEDLSIGHARCIDASFFGRQESRKDPNQRPACGCSPSTDIGRYDTCIHGCAYCYANAGQTAALRRHAAHDPASPNL